MQRPARSLRRQARLLFISLMLVMLCSPAGNAEGPCAWLNAATASGILGVPVTVSAVSANKVRKGGSCEFIQQDGGSVTILQIEVRTVSQPQASFVSYVRSCGFKPQPLAGVGNEAVVCRRKGKRHWIGVRVVGRVRDQILLVNISSRVPKADESALQRSAGQISEQVASNLF